MQMKGKMVFATSMQEHEQQEHRAILETKQNEAKNNGL